ncbi:tetratricopeptide repeat protein [Streptomyces sp. NPDC087851]|uniref:tetratricopeptide repeat protein n=1 Tax=Streptomyces sp. NPDC087851 TaxID=3365810 RepID=UPI003822CF9B
MVQRGFSQETLAEAICTTSQWITAKPVSCTGRQVRRLLSGEIAWPGTAYRAALEKIFQVPPDEMGFVPTASYRSKVRAKSPQPPDQQEQPMLRRQFVLGLTGAVLSLPSLPTAGRLGMSDIDRIRTTATQLHQLDNLHGGTQVAEIAARYIEYVEQAARHCTYGGTVQTALHRTLGELSASCAWFHFDAGQQDTARRWWDTGLRYALLGRDRLLQARIWSSMSHQATLLGHGAEAVAIARAALEDTRGARDGTLSSLLHTRVAQGHAVQGEKGWCGKSLARAEQAYDQAPAEPLRWLGFYSTGEIASTTALCYLDLGRHDQAVDSARTALDAVLATPFRRNHLAGHVRLARCLGAAGELDAAMAAGHSALSLVPEVRSPRIMAGLVGLRDDLLIRRPAGAADFSERYKAVVT